MLIDMKVSQLAVDPFTNMPIVILKDQDGRQAVPIWIGLVEASAIATELENIHLDRPMTHDLMKNVLGRCGICVDRVEVHDLRQNTFFATIYFRKPDGEVVAVDARPSDAIALALRTDASILVAKEVIDKTRRIDLSLTVPAVELAKGAHLADAPVDLCPEREAAISAELLLGLGEGAFGKWKM
jgi:bifunctional DNase/RNase